MNAVADVRKIRRMPTSFLEPDVEAEMRAAVIEKAHEKFGYRGAAFNTRGALAQALAKLEIVPLDSIQVAGYMASRVADYTYSPEAREVKGTFSAVTLVYWFTFGFLTRWGFGFRSSQSGWLFALFMVGLVLTIVTFVALCSGFTKVRVRRTWHEIGLTDYNSYIPVHVLNKAVQIADEVPQANLVVLQLTEYRQSIPAPDPDPFLRVRYGSETYYIDVWDEREFEAKA